MVHLTAFADSRYVALHSFRDLREGYDKSSPPPAKTEPFRDGQVLD